MRIAIIPVMAAFTAALVATASPAHCDANSYLAYLNSHGTFVMAHDDATKVSYGLQACEMLHAGMTPEQVGSSVSPSDERGIVAAAQHELCPDTLH
jgi:Protein of unknown function (DUF732)